MGRQYIADITGLTSTTVTYLACKVIEFGEKSKIMAITPFKVIEDSINQSPYVLLVINTNRHPISYRFGVIGKHVVV